MLKMLSGIAFGYFLYTENGRKQLNQLGNYVTNYIKNSVKEVNSLFIDKNKKEDNSYDANSKISSEQDNGRIERS